MTCLSRDQPYPVYRRYNFQFGNILISVKLILSIIFEICAIFVLAGG
jgi:hypothetical protein